MAGPTGKPIFVHSSAEPERVQVTSERGVKGGAGATRVTSSNAGAAERKGRTRRQSRKGSKEWCILVRTSVGGSEKKESEGKGREGNESEKRASEEVVVDR